MEREPGSGDSGMRHPSQEPIQPATAPKPLDRLASFPSWLPLLLGTLTAVGPLSTDMYLPSFPAIEASLRAPEGSAQLTLAAWFAGLAVGQLTQGTLADRFGRRGPLIAGTLLYCVASVGCALAPDLLTLSICRALSALGGSASMVIPRAVVRDLAEGHAAARLMSRLMLVMGVAPILAPTLGGLVLGVASWHAIFWLTAAYGGLSAVAVWFLLPDTLPRDRRITLNLGSLVNRYLGVLRDRVFLTYAVMGGCCMFGMFAYIGGSPPVLIERFGLTPPQYGMLFGCCAGSFILGSQVNPRLLPRFGAPRIIRWGVRTYLGATATLLLLAVLDVGGIFAVALPILVAMGSMGFVMPNSAVGALSRQAAQAGSASALMGTLQFCLAAVSGVLVGALTDNTARPMAALMLLGAACAAVAEATRPRSRP